MRRKTVLSDTPDICAAHGTLAPFSSAWNRASLPRNSSPSARTIRADVTSSELPDTAISCRSADSRRAIALPVLRLFWPMLSPPLRSSNGQPWSGRGWVALHRLCNGDAQGNARIYRRRERGNRARPKTASSSVEGSGTANRPPLERVHPAGATTLENQLLAVPLVRSINWNVSDGSGVKLSKLICAAGRGGLDHGEDPGSDGIGKCVPAVDAGKESRQDRYGQTGEWSHAGRWGLMPSPTWGRSDHRRHQLIPPVGGCSRRPAGPG